MLTRKKRKNESGECLRTTKKQVIDNDKRKKLQYQLTRPTLHRIGDRWNKPSRKPNRE
jgi:hypothetical protein